METGDSGIRKAQAMNRTFGVLLAAAFMATAQVARAQVDCVEVELFKVDRSQIDSKKDKRAAMIPRKALVTLQESIVLEIPLSIPGVSGMYAIEEACPTAETAVVVGGTISDYKKGSKALRYWVGLGAGAQKFAVEATVRTKATNEVLAADEIVDRKVGGLLGGEDEKGVDDFSEKVAAMVRKAIGR